MPLPAASTIRECMEHIWRRDGVVLNAMCRYISLPALSPGFNPDWSANRNLDTAARDMAAAVIMLAEECHIDPSAFSVEVIGSETEPVLDPDGMRRSPMLLLDIPAHGTSRNDGTVLLYGHLDKQPGLDGRWSPGKGPFTPVFDGDRLFGRGSADDGYAVFAAVSSIFTAQFCGLHHPRCVVLIESGEESGSPDLEYYLGQLTGRLGRVELIVCLDSGCHDYQRLWLTDSLRGVCSGTLQVEVLREGVHSGDASGIVPTPFRIATALLARLENPENGTVLLPSLVASIPDQVVNRTRKAISVIGEEGIWRHFPFEDGVRPVINDPLELTLNRTWRSQMVVKGLDGVPPTSGAGNVLLPSIALGLSLRLPPTTSSRMAALAVKETLEKDPPYHSKVRFDIESTGDGWCAPELRPQLARTLEESSQEFFGGDIASMGEGGSIPFMALLKQMFPEAGFVVTGVLGPESNAHGPDESLHLPTAARLGMCLTKLLGAAARSPE